MDIPRKLERFGSAGTLSRVIRLEEKMPNPEPTGPGLVRTESTQGLDQGGWVKYSVQVKMALIETTVMKDIGDTQVVQPGRLMLSVDLLARQGYPLPVQEGDQATTLEKTVTIRQIQPRNFRGQTMLVCQVEG